MDLKELDAVEPNEHWYYQSKLVALRMAAEKYAPSAKCYVDVGAGSGFFSCELADFDSGSTVTCVDPYYAAETTERDGAVRYCRSLDSADADVFLFIDVVEHVEDDVSLVRQYTGSAHPGALALITAPAFMSLWSAHDEYLEHHRRYTLSQLVEVAGAAGLEVLEARYLFGSIFPLVWVVRRIRRNAKPNTDLRPAPSLVNRLLGGVLGAEHRWTRNKMAGVTAFVVARVPEATSART